MKTALDSFIQFLNTSNLHVLKMSFSCSHEFVGYNRSNPSPVLLNEIRSGRGFFFARLRKRKCVITTKICPDGGLGLLEKFKAC